MNAEPNHRSLDGEAKHGGLGVTGLAKPISLPSRSIWLL
jgi:hypothetical protein